MHLQGQDLRIDSRGDVVSLLHRELGELGFTLPEQEVEGSFFGRGTQEAVKDFQRNNDLAITGVVDESTARAINTAVHTGQKEPQRFVVQGTVRWHTGESAAGVLVSANDRDLRHMQPLGETETDRHGTYNITYSRHQFRRAEKRSADLVVRVFNPAGDRLGESEIVFNAPAVATMDLEIEKPAELKSSEFERLMADLEGILEEVDLADLTEEDITFLSGETSIDRRRIEFLSDGAKLSRETNIPTEIYYGWRRTGMTQGLEQLIALPSEKLQSALETAIHEYIIAPRFREMLDEIMRRIDQLRFDHGLLVTIEIIGTLSKEETDEPLPGFTIQTAELNGGDKSMPSGSDITDRTGRFSIVFNGSHRSTTDEAGLERDEAVRRFRLTIIDSRGEEIYTTEIRIYPEDEQVLKIRIPADALSEPGDTTVHAVAGTIGFGIPGTLSNHLKSMNINTLADIRRAGGVAKLADLPVPTDHESVRLLDAHANLSVLSHETTENHALIQQGFTNISAVAGSSRCAFIRAMHEDLGDLRAAQLHVKARAQTRILDNLLTTRRMDLANGNTAQAMPNHLDVLKPEDKSEFEKIFPKICSCKECESAVSPLAYLADLLDYAVTNIKNDGAGISLTWLSEKFHQPFATLPASCEEMNRKVRQIRICIEVLRRYLETTGIPPAKAQILAESEHAYALAAYTTLLTRIGTSYDTIRLIQNAGDDERRTLADRLGIGLDPDGSDPLGSLFLDPTDAEALSEEALEKLFGLVDTSRDPSCYGVKQGDPQNQITRWTLTGVEWNRNTDADGSIHVTLREEDGLKFIVELYCDEARTQLMASGERTTPVGIIRLSEQNSNGLSGAVTINFTGNTDTVHIVAVPRFLSWRLHHLRKVWRDMDRPVDDYFENAVGQLPFIDPDVIGPDDFRHSTAANPAFDIWVNRRNWVDAQILTLSSCTRIVNNEQVPDPEAMLDSMYQPVTYGQYSETPWAATTPVEHFHTLNENLKHGIDSEGTRFRIETDLRLTVESFQCLMEIRAKDQAADRNPDSEPVGDGQWRELHSILVQARKKAFFKIWIKEEKQPFILFGPDSFWISLREPVEGDWPPVPQPDEPLIDPERLGQNDLPEPTRDVMGLFLWHSRKESLDQIHDNLKFELESNGFDSAMRWAIGDPNPGDPLPPHDLSTLESDLTGSDPNVVDAAEDIVINNFHMTADDFLLLMEIKAKAESADPELQPTEQEIAQICSILTTAQKTKREYPAWVQEEAGIDYWELRKAEIPRWRASAEARTAWQQALQARSQRSIIDPDVVGADHLRGSGPGGASGLWMERYEWIHDPDPEKGQLAELKVAREAEPTAVDGFNSIIENVLGVGAFHLEELARQQETGHNISARLEQLTLSGNAFAYLDRIRRLLADDPNVALLDSEWDDVYSILVQVHKHRSFAQWRQEEETRDLILGPDDFCIPDPPAIPQFPPPEPKPVPDWRAQWRDRRDWQDTLQSRIDQETSVIDALGEAVDATEEETLPRLRNALIAALDKGGSTFEGKAGWVTDNLLIDAGAGACQVTTRIARAIETIQLLLWSVRTGQLKDICPELSLEDDSFDDAWEWIGSYGSWRAAMFVFMYPENVLMPSLRNRQTPAFRTLVDTVRQNRRLTPEDACAAARNYADYFRDICTLKVEATCQANTRLRKGKGCKGMAPVYSPLFYMFGRSKSTNKVYWSAYNPEDGSQYAQTFWKAVPGLENVLEIAGAVPYNMGSDQRCIFLFALVMEKGRKRIVFSRYDLEAPDDWESEPSGELELPPDDVRRVIARQDRNEKLPPTLLIQCNKQLRYIRSLDRECGGWEVLPEYVSGNNEWDFYNIFSYPEIVMPEIHALLYKKPPPDWILMDEYIAYRLADDQLLQPFTPANTPLLSNASWIGAFQWSDGAIFILLKTGPNQSRGILIKDKKEQGSLPTDSRITRVARSFSLAPAGIRQLAFEMSGKKQGTYYSPFDIGSFIQPTNPTRALPCVKEPLDIPHDLSGAELQLRRVQVENVFLDNADGPESNLTYLREAYYFVPMYLALQLQKRGEYIAALDWFRSVYDYSVPKPERKIYYGLAKEESGDMDFARQDDWLLDPLDPHAIAGTRKNTYTRFTLMSTIRCLLEYADAEFTRDTVESTARARTLYLTALDLLEDDALQQTMGECADLIGELEIEVGEGYLKYVLQKLKYQLALLQDQNTLETTIHQVTTAMESQQPWQARITEAQGIVARALAAQPGPPGFAAVLDDDRKTTATAHSILLRRDAVADAVAAGGRLAAGDYLGSVASVLGKDAAKLVHGKIPLPWLRGVSGPDSGMSIRTSLGGTGLKLQEASRPDRLGALTEEAPAAAVAAVSRFSVYYVRPPSYRFCIPPNPMIRSLRLHMELNLHKLRTCRNIAGMQRQLTPYAAPTDTVTGLPMIGVGGQLVLPGISTMPPTQYRYPVLIERAKQLVGLATQIESGMLSAIEKRDAEYYNLLKARQDVQVTRQGVRLQNLRLKEAEDGVRLAELQREHAQIRNEHYTELLKYPDTFNEIMQKSLLESAIELSHDLETALITQAAFGGASPAQMPFGIGSGAAGGAAAAYSTQIQRDMMWVQIYALANSIELRTKEWELQKNLAVQDKAIGNQQVKLANDHVRVVGQEQKIAEMLADHAEETMEFLTNKFTNVELYDWMSDILEGVYSFFLQQATATAKLAENQLAFERQATPPAFIQADYWEAPAGMEVGGDPHSSAPDRRGLTGSARLLQDIHQLDRYAFETDKRKLQLAKTISLSRLAPLELQRFRETGVLLFATPMELFDRDFPGHYLRLIKRVRTSVVALVPPTEGIHATLSTTGLSRVAIGGAMELFQTVPVITPPQSVALTSPVNATGVFELTRQSQEMLLPFEGMGVDSSWEFRMPKASNLFDYSTIADVLITIEYTALDSYDYRQLVIQQLDRSMSSDRPFSFRHQFADQWYHLHNPELKGGPMTVTFQTRHEDFPPNVDDIRIQNVVLFFTRKHGADFEVAVDRLCFTELGGTASVGGGAGSIDGIISTRRGNAGSWTALLGKSPVGEWELTLPAETGSRFKNEEIEDILLVITYSGRTPEWPQ